MTAGYPLQRIGVDILGPLESTPSGNQYDLVLTNYFTKWMAAFPLTNMETSTVAMVLVEKYIAVGGDGDMPFVRHQEDTILSITTRKGMNMRRGSTGRCSTCCPSLLMGTRTSGTTCCRLSCWRATAAFTRARG
ncbi:retrovirus-related Pol polyprotein from transposon 412 [Trichinella spiralis]|uniref:retrovirus-related Pol polyprotein from transposon 412 n=1 Tax=Trichinella spiralis TaxID=6334 RepID=UPI0001EFDFF3|nr:retrovirus-related Pol polyprotein from transposon 412 [Trichinella spiralis]